MLVVVAQSHGACSREIDVEASYLLLRFVVGITLQTHDKVYLPRHGIWPGERGRSRRYLVSLAFLVRQHGRSYKRCYGYHDFAV